MAGTVRLVQTQQTAAYGKKVKREPLQLLENPVLSFQGQNYEILSDSFIGNGGEADVFLAREMATGEEFAAKIYVNTSLLTEKIREPVIAFLRQHLDYKKYHLMPLVAYGVIRAKLLNQSREYDLPVEILPYCPNAEVKKADFQTLRNQIIPQINTALHTMHTEKLLHRDIKPDNIYLYKGVYVIADFGTTTRVEEVENEVSLHVTSQKRGTVGYTAPEVWNGYAEELSDYYSLGCTIATIYKGHHVYEDLLSLDNGADMQAASTLNASIRTKGMPLDCPPEESSLQDLVNGLILVDTKDRVGYDGVILWTQDPQAFVDIYKNRISLKSKTDFEFNFEGTVCHSEKELAHAMGTKWQAAEGYLYRSNSMLLQYYSNYNASTGNQLAGIVEERVTARNRDLGLAKAIHYIYPEGLFYWKGHSFNSLKIIGSAIAEQKIDKADVIKMLQSRYLSWKIQEAAPKAEHVISVIKKCEDTTGEFPNLGYYMFKYTFSQKEAGLSGDKTNNHFRKLSEDPFVFNRFADNFAIGDQWLGYLATYESFFNNVIKLKRSLNEENPQLESIYIFYESIVTDKTLVREYYYKYGPHSYIYWVLQNMDLYSFNTEKAREKRDLLLTARFFPEMTIEELHNTCTEMGQNMSDFWLYFQNNLLLALLGIGNSPADSDITTYNSDAYFSEIFCDHLVPIGYIHYLKDKAAGKVR